MENKQNDLDQVNMPRRRRSYTAVQIRSRSELKRDRSSHNELNDQPVSLAKMPEEILKEKFDENTRSDRDVIKSLLELVATLRREIDDLKTSQKCAKCNIPVHDQKSWCSPCIHEV